MNIRNLMIPEHLRADTQADGIRSAGGGIMLSALCFQRKQNLVHLLPAAVSEHNSKFIAGRSGQ